MAQALANSSNGLEADELGKKLQGEGLDPNVWLPVFKNEFNITTFQSLRHLEEKDLDKLNIQQDWEKKALKSLMKKAKKSTPKIIKQFGNFIKKKISKNEKEEEVKKTDTEQVIEALEVPKEPRVNRIQQNEEIQSLIKNMEETVSIPNEPKMKKETISDQDILKHASGGLALEGIYNSESLENALLTRGKLMKVPANFALTKSKQNQIFEQFQFTSIEEESTFRKEIEKLGYSMTCSSNVNILNVGLKFKTKHQTSGGCEETSPSSSASMYASTTKYSYVPLASCFFEKDDLLLSESALKFLSSIDKSQTENEKNKCLEFFNLFGTHANQGPIHFGGIFWWKASLDGFERHDLNEVKKMTASALSAFVGAGNFEPFVNTSGGIDVGSSNPVGSVITNGVETANRNLKLSISKTGGPIEASNLTQWQNELNANNKTWSVIDRGLQIIPVWEIILQNHKNDFIDHVSIAKCLEDAYCTLTNQPPSLDTLEHEIQLLLEDVIGWDVNNAEDYFTKLLDHNNSDIVIKSLLSNKNFQGFLNNWATKAKTENHKNIMKMRFLIQSLLDHCTTKIHFPNDSQIFQWIQQTECDSFSETIYSTLPHFIELLHQIKSNLKEVTFSRQQSKCNLRFAQIEGNNEITKAIRSIRNNLASKEEFAILLMIVRVVGYSHHDGIFNHLLDWKELEFLDEKLGTVHSEYLSIKKDSPIKAQGFVIKTGLTITELSSLKKNENLDCMKILLENCLFPEIKNLIDFVAEPPLGWSQLENDLSSVSIRFPTKEEQINIELAKEVLKQNENMPHYPTCHQWKVIQKLGLEKFYPKKMSLSEVLVISKNVLENKEPSSNEEIASYFLQKLLMMDYLARDLLLASNVVRGEDSESNLPSASVHDFLNENLFEEFNEAEDEIDFIHPMDVQMAIYYCADNFLWQYMASKLSFCQYALPILIPNPFTQKMELPSWSLLSLDKSWESTTIHENQFKKTDCQPIYMSELPFVTFMKFGKSHVSKSQIISNLLTNQKHDTFFHRNCKNSSVPPILMDGVVEMAWYFPSQKVLNVFDECIAFTNLHGDIINHEKQFELLSKISTINIILMTKQEMKDPKNEKILQKLFNSAAPLICLRTDEAKTINKQKGKNIQLAAANTNADFIEKLKSTIKQMLQCNPRNTTSIKECVEVARNCDILIGEDIAECKKAKQLAEQICNILKSETSIFDIKKKYFPLQGQLWQQWCRKNKELHRLQATGNMSIEQHKSLIEQAKNDIRKEQGKKTKPMNKVMKDLIHILQSNSEETKKYFVKWIEILFKEITKEKFNETNPSKEGLGFQHFLRELGQIFEATDAAYLPGMVADLMISGYPIELMDGDAAHVPMKWISSVLDKVIEKIGDKKVFIVSVLGLQSSGKSTLLNAMFGLEFTVSAGRCTKGAFMQLIKVNDNLRRDMRFDYVLVVDTEGLRSLEVGESNLNRDNELATFVIGLANLTLINIFGENPSDMQDILQIAVQAFLRMKLVGLSPSCIFVHQNVGESGAKEKNKEAQLRMLEKLNKMTETAAKQENCDESLFQDVIRFNMDTDIIYFSHLWEGNPPMAPPNPCYSNDIKELKKMILVSEANKNMLSISEFKRHIQNLWDGLLDENFVFSFKNTLEIAAFKKLEAKFAEWTWMLSSQMQIVENRLKIQNASADIITLENQMNACFTEVNQDINTFFTENEENEKTITVQWKEKYLKRIKDFKDHLLRETKKNLDLLSQQKKNCLKLDQQKATYEDTLLKKSKNLALMLKGRGLDEERLKSEFDNMWIKWVTEVSSNMPPAEEIDIRNEAVAILFEILVGDPIKTRMDIGIYKNIGHLNNFSEVYLKIKKVKFVFQSISEDEANTIMFSLTDSIIGKVRDFVKNKEAGKYDYNPNFFREIVRMIDISVKQFKSHEERFTLSNDFKTDLCLMLCFEAAKNFQTLHNAFQEANSPLTYLKGKKQSCFATFKNFCEGAMTTKILADLVGSELEVAIKESVYLKANTELASEIRSNTPAFKGNRSNLESHILKNLAEEEKFDNFLKYIKTPKTYFEDFISMTIKSYCWRSKNTPIIKTVYANCLEYFNCRVKTVIRDTTDIVQRKRGDVGEWLDVFCSELNEDLGIVRQKLNCIEFQDITDISFLQDAMIDVLKQVTNVLNNDFNEEYPESRYSKSSREEIQKKLLANLCGCWSQCPFCKAICTNTIPDHDGDHSVELHRPQAVKGRRWADSVNFVTDICSSDVASECSFLSNDVYYKHKEYRKAGSPYDSWSITPDTSFLPYWKWFVCKFQTDLEKHYGYKFQDLGAIPEQWQSISKGEAIESLNIAQ